MDPNQDTPQATPPQPYRTPQPSNDPQQQLQSQPEPQVQPVPQSVEQPPVRPQSPQQQSVQSDDPGKTLGIVGLVLAFIMPLVGLIVSIIAKRKSSKAGHANTLAKVGIILGAIFTVVGLIVGTIMLIGSSALFSKCQELGPGTHNENGVTYTC